MLASMSEIDPHLDTPLVNWGELAMSGLVPTGTVSLLLADVEGSTRLWENSPQEMSAALARLQTTVSEVVAAHDGVRPVEQGEGDSFVVAFPRASDAVACAVELQRAPLAPIRLRIGIHTGEVLLRDEANYAGPVINRTARLRDLAHGGQTVLSGATEELVAERLPQGAWLTDLGTHALRDLPRPERVVQLCHPDLVNDFPPLRTPKAVAASNLPVQLTRFVGRENQLTQLRAMLAENRLVTLTGAGGSGKTRLAVQVAGRLADEFGRFPDGVWYADLAPITDPEVVPVAVARALGLPDQPGRSTMDTLTRFVADRRMLMVLDNCEHLLDACADLVVALLGSAAGLTVLATSREAIGVAGEVGWRVPSLSLADEAVELFADRVRHIRPDFAVSAANTAAVSEICRRLDGLPLAIELAAARMRALSLAEILESLHDRFRLLTGGARTAVRRQQTLRASVDWSHALLTEPERVLFRRLAAFLGGFDLPAARAVAGYDEVEPFQVLDLLTLLVDKSLVLADDNGASGVRGRTRYRLLETVRQYALEQLGESREADIVRARHRDHYTAMAALIEAPAGGDYEGHIERADLEIDNLRAAFGWSRENREKFGNEQALALASSLQPLWQARGRLREGLTWFDTALADGDAQHSEVAPAVRARALADSSLLGFWVGTADSPDRAQQALAIAREVGDPALLARALAASGYIVGFFDADVAREYLAEAISLARELGDRWRLSQILVTQAIALLGDPIALRAAAEEGRDLADAIGDRFGSRRFRWRLGLAQLLSGELAAALAQFAAVAGEAEAAHDEIFHADGLACQGVALAHQGDAAGARAAAEAAVVATAELGGLKAGVAYWALVVAALAGGDVATAQDASEAAWPHESPPPQTAANWRIYKAQAALAGGDLVAAGRWADDAVSTTRGALLSEALTTRARAAIALGEPDRAERDLHDALACAAEVGAYLFIPDILDCLGTLGGQAGSHREAARLFGAAAAIRARIGSVRFQVYAAGYEASTDALRNTMGEAEFDAAWAEGAALSTEEAIGYAQRGRGQRKRPSSGWAALTPTEREVVRLVSQGLANNDIATRLFVSPRTVQSHLTHVYTKLGLSSRVQLVHEAARHG